MKYFHCPREYKRAAYGCGFGPVNATVAFLDLDQHCPRCGKALRPYQKPKLSKASGPCSVTSLVTGERYCEAPARVLGTDGERYCARHQYLAVASKGESRAMFGLEEIRRMNDDAAARELAMLRADTIKGLRLAFHRGGERAVKALLNEARLMLRVRDGSINIVGPGINIEGLDN